MTRSNLVLSSALALTALAAPALAQRSPYKNLVNKPFATISSGPQSSVVLDIPKGKDIPTAVEARLRKEWQARSRALAPSLSQQKRSAVFPISTLVTVRQSGRIVTPRVTRAFGDGQLTFAFENFNGASIASGTSTLVVEDFLKDFINAVYPRLVALYGKPAFSGEVKIRSMGFFNTGTATDIQRLAFGAYSPSENRIYLPLYQSVDSLAHACLLNLIHAFHGPLTFQYDAWEQGFARAAATIIARDPALGFSDPTANSLYTLLPYYDLLNQPALGNNTFFPPSQANLFIDGEITIAKMLQSRMGMSGAAWLKCYIENKDFFKSFNAAYYAAADAQGAALAGNVPALKSLAAGVLPAVESLPFSEWFAQQYILDTSVTTGPKLYAYVLPRQPSAGNGEQSSLIALVYYRTKPDGDEELLSGRAYATYFNSDNARITLGGGSQQTQIEAGEGFLTTLAFPNQGFDDGRLVADFAVGGLTTRTYLSQGINGDFLGIMTGGVDGDVAVSQTTVLAPITTRNATAKVARRGFGVTVGAQLGEFSKTTVSITSGPTVQTFQRNTGDGINYVVLRPVGAGGGVTTLSRAFPVGNLNLVSFPVRPLEPTVEGALGRSATDFLLAGWDPITRVYAAVAPNTPSIGLLEPGKGYFLKFLPNGGPINTTVSLTGITPATDVDYTLHLAYGWNLIGTPFSQDLDITKTSVKYLENDAIVFGAATGADANNAPYGSLIAEQVWGLNQETGAYNPTNSLSADWRGYWVRVYAPQGVTLLIPGPDTPGRSVPTRALVPTASRKPDWAVRLRATQGKRSSEVALGAAAGATRSFDPRWDIEAPPDVVPGVSLALGSEAATAGGRMAADFRSGQDANRGTWPLSLTSAQSGNVTLAWDGLETLPKTLRLTLLDTATGARFPLASRSGWSVAVQAGQTRKLQIVAEAERSQVLGITNVLTRSAGRASGGSIRLEYSLTADADVQAEISTLAGRSVRRLTTSRGRATERQSVLWNGLTDSGQPLPAGGYLVTLTARTDDGQTARVIRPIQILR